MPRCGGASAPSSTKAACSARTASSVYFSSITTEILISLVRDHLDVDAVAREHPNIFAATPAWSFMPRPTIEIFAMAGSASTRELPSCGATSRRDRERARCRPRAAR